jgi:hypothetical protein
MQFTRYLLPLALLTAASFTLPTQATQGPGPTTGPSKEGHEYGTPPDKVPCPGIGTQWNNGKIVEQGLATCPSIVAKVNIGYDQNQIEVVVRVTGCPAYVVIAPGYYGQVNKPGHKILGSQELHAKMQEFKCLKHIFSANECIATGAPTEDPATVTSFVEGACGHVVGEVPN